MNLNMRLFNKTILLGAMALSLLSSCKKEFLELNPPTALPNQQALGTEGDLQVALRGAYSGLRSANLFGRTTPVIGDVYADNGYISVQNSNRYVLWQQYALTVANGDVAGQWAAAYTVILRANNIINSPIAANPNVNQYKGEAYAIRALCYFTLIRWYARPYTDNPNGPGVPLILSYNPDQKGGRATVQEVYNQILSDLTQAYTLMTQYTNSSQFSKYAARGLQAKVYLTMGDMANARTAAVDVINNGGFTLVTAANYVAYWNNAAVTTNKVETLFEVSSDAVNNNAFDALGYIYSQLGYGDILMSDELYSRFDPADARLGLYSTGTRGGVPAIFVNKYPSLSGDRSDTKVLRLSEIYLIAAEATALTDATASQGYLNAVRSRRNLPNVTATGQALIDAIILERRLELAFEGDRYMDLMRLKLPVVRSTNYTPATARNIPYADFRRVLPIPQQEIDANDVIRNQQNPGW